MPDWPWPAKVAVGTVVIVAGGVLLFEVFLVCVALSLVLLVVSYLSSF